MRLAFQKNNVCRIISIRFLNSQQKEYQMRHQKFKKKKLFIKILSSLDSYAKMKKDLKFCKRNLIGGFQNKKGRKERAESM